MFFIVVSESEGFLAAFRSAATLKDEEEALVACLGLCERIEIKASSCNSNAAALLAGIPEEDYDMYTQISDPIVVSGDLLSTSLSNLLSSMDPKVSVFNKGKFLCT